MSPLIISLGAGVFIGLFYALLNVRSPAPPAIALIGLLGMIIGTQIVAPTTHSGAVPSTSVGTVKGAG